MSLQKCQSEGRKEGRRGPEGGEEERGQDINVHIPPLAQRLLFGFFHSSALQ